MTGAGYWGLIVLIVLIELSLLFVDCAVQAGPTLADQDDRIMTGEKEIGAPSDAHDEETGNRCHHRQGARASARCWGMAALRAGGIDVPCRRRLESHPPWSPTFDPGVRTKVAPYTHFLSTVWRHSARPGGTTDVSRGIHPTVGCWKKTPSRQRRLMRWAPHGMVPALPSARTSPFNRH